MTLVETPMTRANTPNAAIKTFLAIIKFNAAPCLLSLNTNVSNKAGKASPSNERHKAPNKEMNKSNFGIATARTTMKFKKSKENMLNRSILGSELKCLTNEKNKHSANHILPKKLVTTTANFINNISVPSKIYCNIASNT